MSDSQKHFYVTITNFIQFQRKNVTINFKLKLFTLFTSLHIAYIEKVKNIRKNTNLPYSG